ncbi:Tubulin polyglutamylase complex subunit 2 [Hondaea fermentalgiana]|uniref:Tubulin polyglutamylase complex subunit 2 n=1 Tax=Hondaea fermentalgiana TaxID=2315210 RepID=A0A2R5GSN9_9STRA|nr:Tubulin polyglutamylase complex subunit 2 [Hondaea fermentalgiana]|eukprot:GBG31391.1 Tubulin polyglutamylase complex subunit 2 [Hondaea fermentalgiana]
MRPAVGRSSEDARRGARRHELKTLSAASLLQTLPASRDDVLERKTDPESETPIQISAGSVRGPHVRAGSVSREQVKAGTNRQTCLSASAIASSALGKELSQVHAAVVARGGGIWALSEVPGVDEQAVKQWERDHGVAVAADLLDFLQATDGILVRWAVPLFGRVKDIGCLHVNSLRFIDPVASEDLRGSPIASRQAFALGKQKRVGLTALVYPRRYVSRREDQPEVWFCDLSGSWHFMAARFADYFRLALVHLGIRGWEYAFTPGGLDPVRCTLFFCYKLGFAF